MGVDARGPATKGHAHQQGEAKEPGPLQDGRADLPGCPGRGQHPALHRAVQPVPGQEYKYCISSFHLKISFLLYL